MFRDGARVAYSGPDLPGEFLMAGHPGIMIDDNGPAEITVSFEYGPSISLPASELVFLPSAEWNMRRDRLRRGVHPMTEEPVDHTGGDMP